MLPAGGELQGFQREKAIHARLAPSKILLAFVFFLACLGGCGLIYTNVHVPRAYRSATPGDVPTGRADKVVSGEACNQSVLFLVAWGDGGYAAAVKKALEDAPPTAILYDVKADMRAQSVLLGLYTRVCTIVTGKVAYP